RRARGGSEVGAIVAAPALVNRVHPPPESGRDSREFKRIAKEGLVQTVAFRGVVGLVPVSFAVQNDAMGLALVHEFGGEDSSGAYRDALVVDRLIHHAETVPRAQVAREVDLGTEDLCKTAGNTARNACRITGPEKRVSDGAGAHLDEGLHLCELSANGGETVPLALDDKAVAAMGDRQVE